MISISDKFKIEMAETKGRTTILLKGIIDEDTNFIMSKKEPPFYFNFKEVTGINSCGIRSWVNFLNELGETEVFFEECPPLIVRQMNMVPSFVGHATILSVFTPYVCNECEQEKLVLIPKETFEKRKNIQESFPCALCKKGEMELDGHPDQYFAFSK